MAEGTSVCVVGLSNHRDLSTTGKIWIDAAVQAGCGFNSGERRRGIQEAGRSDKARFMNIAQGSIEECRYYLILAGDLGYCDNREDCRKLTKSANSLIAAVRQF